MSQVQLSQRIAEKFGREPESVRRSLVNNETGRYSPRLYMLEAIAEATGQPLSFFAVEGEGGDGNPDGEPFRDAA